MVLRQFSFLDPPEEIDVRAEKRKHRRRDTINGQPYRSSPSTTQLGGKQPRKHKYMYGTTRTGIQNIRVSEELAGHTCIRRTREEVEQPVSKACEPPPSHLILRRGSSQQNPLLLTVRIHLLMHIPVKILTYMVCQHHIFAGNSLSQPG